MATTLRINNDYTILESDNSNLKDVLFKQLRFRSRNYFFNKAYRDKKWDGFVNFYQIETGKLLTGLLPEVYAVLKFLNVEYKVIDERENIKFVIEKVNENFLNQFLKEGNNPINLYDYQVDFINGVIKNKRCIIQSPTGSGKSLSIIAILKTLPINCPSIILVNRIGLADQLYNEIIQWCDELKVGKVWGKEVNPQLITIATVQSIKKIEKLLPKYKVLIVDEIHLMMSDSTKSIYRKMKNCSVRVGVSATPFKFGEKDLVQKYFVKGFFGPVLKTKITKSGILTVNDLKDREILSKSKCIFYPINKPELPYEIYFDAVQLGQVSNQFFHDVVKKLVDGLSGRSLLLVHHIDHGNKLFEMLPKALWIQGKDTVETRKIVVEQLRTSKNVVAIATEQIFGTGIDVKIHNLINCTDVCNSHSVLQIAGRGLRLADDKDILNYYDFIFNINPYLYKHSMERVKILQKQGHEVIIKDKIDF